MRKTLVWVAAFMMSGSVVWADVCTDLANQYASLITRLQQETEAALSQTTDPAEQMAIRESYTIQLASLQAERDATLTASGCNGPTDPGTDPGTGPTDPGTDPGTGPTDPGTDPGTGPTDPGLPGSGDQTCKDLMDSVRTQAMTIAATSGKGAAATFVRSKKPEIQAVCGNYGHGRCQVGGFGHDDKDRDGHKDDRDARSCDKPSPKPEVKPMCDTKSKDSKRCDTDKKWRR